MTRSPTRKPRHLDRGHRERLLPAGTFHGKVEGSRKAAQLTGKLPASVPESFTPDSSLRGLHGAE